MPFPVVAGHQTSTSGGAVQDPAVVSLPSGISSGDLLIVRVLLLSVRNGTPPAGWTEIKDEASNVPGFLYAYRFADGSEGSTMSYDLTATSQWRALATRITGAHPTTGPEISTRVNNENAAPDPPSFNPSGWDVEDTLWEALALATNVTAAPSGYSGLTVSNSVMAVAYKNSAAASEDPGTFTAANNQWTTYTIAIRPAPPAANKIAMML